ncbi:MFS transporter [Chitinophaga barathri]|uniref:MFS transporter n=1 Tax=Chitinophaga barathri TaxID=1647451 RepID=A0A3N4N2T5_9BACT|nr:MFS transporter [Chitinophaga barathri]RPD41943.1 MFS transporter [Chitinophaga barathri]
MSNSNSTARELLRLPVLVAAFGYLVDMYDLFLFSVVRVPSLQSLGLRDDALLHTGAMLLNMQMFGLLIGGIIWGVLGDKKGRLSVLFGSILIYSLANLANGFVETVPQYAFMRFIAGIGLAGELGAGVTLVAEVLPRKIRGYGTTLVATLGVIGAIMAYFMADLFEWRISYFIGGGLGLLLLLLRVRVFESGIYAKTKAMQISRGSFISLFTNGRRALRYLQCIAIGLPIWFAVGILITFSPEFGKAMQLNAPVVAGKAVMLAFAGQVFGDIASGLLSQLVRSRKKIILLFLLLSAAMVAVYLFLPFKDINTFYIFCVLLGFTNGYWALFVTVAAEMFGTNLRATVATTVPNFVRGAVIPLTTLFLFLKPSWGVLYSAGAVGLLTMIIALLALRGLDETFEKDLDYVE